MRQKYCLACLASIALIWLLAGCKSEAQKASDTDAFGFICLECGDKFYTSTDLIPEHCPSHKHMRVRDAMGYVLEDGELIIGVAGGGPDFGTRKPQKVRTTKLPHEKELLASGFKKATAAQVMRK